MLTTYRRPLTPPLVMVAQMARSIRGAAGPHQRGQVKGANITTCPSFSWALYTQWHQSHCKVLKSVDYILGAKVQWDLQNISYVCPNQHSKLHIRPTHHASNGEMALSLCELPAEVQPATLLSHCASAPHLHSLWRGVSGVSADLTSISLYLSFMLRALFWSIQVKNVNR